MFLIFFLKKQFSLTIDLKKKQNNKQDGKWGMGHAPPQVDPVASYLNWVWWRNKVTKIPDGIEDGNCRPIPCLVAIPIHSS